MIIKIPCRTHSQLERLNQFMNSQNWVAYPANLNQFRPASFNPADAREVEHTFAKVLRKTRSKREPEKERYDITLEISPYICDIRGGSEIKVPASYLLNLMQALDLFSESYEMIDLDLL